MAWEPGGAELDLDSTARAGLDLPQQRLREFPHPHNGGSSAHDGARRRLDCPGARTFRECYLERPACGERSASSPTGTATASGLLPAWDRLAITEPASEPRACIRTATATESPISRRRWDGFPDPQDREGAARLRRREGGGERGSRARDPPDSAPSRSSLELRAIACKRRGQGPRLRDSTRKGSAIGGVFGVVSRDDCVLDLFYGTDFHSHLGTRRGGSRCGARRSSSAPSTTSRTPSSAPVRRRHHADEGPHGDRVHQRYRGPAPDHRLPPRPLCDRHVGRINNIARSWEGPSRSAPPTSRRPTGEGFNPTEVVASLIRHRRLDRGGNPPRPGPDRGLLAPPPRRERNLCGEGPPGPHSAHHRREARLPLRHSRDQRISQSRLRFERELGPGEIVRISPDGSSSSPRPATSFASAPSCGSTSDIPPRLRGAQCGGGAQPLRRRPARQGGRRDRLRGGNSRLGARPTPSGTPTSPVSPISGPSSSTRPLAASFMPHSQPVRDLVARMKLIPIREAHPGEEALFCEDSIVRGTQLRDTIQRLFDFAPGRSTCAPPARR